MKIWFRMGIIILSILLISGCSLIAGGFDEGGGGESSDGKTDIKKEKTVEEVLEESKKVMDQMSGYRWELSGKQEMKIPDESEDGETTFSGSVDYLETSHYASEIDLKIESSSQSHHTQLKMIVDGETVYLQDKTTGDWVRQQGSAEEIRSMAGLEKQYVDAVEVMDMVFPHSKDLTMEKGDGVRRLTLRLKDHEEIAPFMQFAIEAWEDDDKVKANEVSFSDLELILTVDESNKKLTEVEQRVQVVLPFIDGVSMDVSQNFTSKMTGEVSEISIPEEAKSAPFISE